MGGVCIRDDISNLLISQRQLLIKDKSSRDMLFFFPSLGCMLSSSPELEKHF